MDEILIEKVREYECLYNLRSPDIGKELKISGHKAKGVCEKLRRCLCNARSRHREETKWHGLRKELQSEKKTLNTPAHQMVKIIKESSAFRKRKYENQTTSTNISSINNSLDETDIFFLSMSRMTKQLPKLVQTRIKLQVSNAVLAAEVNAQKSTYVTHYPQHFCRSFQQQSYPTAAPSPQVSSPMTSSQATQTTQDP
ncbi:hypothetical protein RN001_012934 [Aquatica leii]|uniref:MADF domain-containing protein n=1 Tax=Aquatica leii TaxID=1421715 RepID=A0AAN7PPX8_9COLE|nr:hypothetical protein RN001_012934 [Aquatica leii]